MPDKLRIESYNDNSFSPSAKGKVFQAQINPSGYESKAAVGYRTKGAIDGAGQTPSFQTIAPQSLNLVFEFDGTGVVPGANLSVSDRIDQFDAVAYDYSGSIHRPRYLWILWGTLSFKCVLKDYTLEYSLFDPAGEPLRAKLKATFLEFKTPRQIALEASKRSADLTHRRTIVAGDTLPLLCDTIYGNGGYYPLVARFNRLGSFRRLEPGVAIAFPPVRDLLEFAGEQAYGRTAPSMVTASSRKETP